VEGITVPAVLHDRLGPDASAGLLDLLDVARRDWLQDVLTVATDRFERRVIEEATSLRLAIAQGQAALREEMAAGHAALRVEMASGLAAVRQDMAAARAGAREDLASGLAAVRQEMAAGLGRVEVALADTRADLLEWAFLFWIGQVVALAGLMSVLIRAMRP
jgi:hypothetical protein